MATISSSASAEAVNLLQESTTDIPGSVYVVVNRNGESVFSHASGVRNVEDETIPMTIDSSMYYLSDLTPSFSLLQKDISSLSTLENA